MNYNDIIDEILELKLVFPQTKEIKEKIKELEKELDKIQNVKDL